MGQSSSDAAFELIGACVHSLRFAFGAPLAYPYAPARLAEDNPPPALFKRVQAASPPPTRDGRPWQTGMKLDGKDFQPTAVSDRLAEVQHDEGAASLDAPDPQEIVLDRNFRIPRRRQPIAFPGPDRGRYLTSIGYWSPIPSSATTTVEQVEYFDTFRMDWDRPPVGDWVAVSFEAFWPAERDMADLIIPLGECDGECPRAAGS